LIEREKERQRSEKRREKREKRRGREEEEIRFYKGSLKK
jgi:hypothetical protein